MAPSAPPPPARNDRPSASSIFCAAVVGMIGLAVVAAITMMWLEDFGGMEDVVLFFAIILGTVAGLIHAPFICVILRRANFNQAFPFVYGWAIIPTVVSTIFFGPLSAIVAIIAVLVLSVVAVRRYPVIVSGTCEKCGYSLHGLPQPGCPECGWRRKA